MRTVILSEEDRKELIELYEKARDIPVICTLKQWEEGRDIASLAWNVMNMKIGEFGKKYGFNPENITGIKKKTGEVFLKRDDRGISKHEEGG